MAAGKQAGGDPTPWIALTLMVGAFAGSLGHLYDVAEKHGAGWEFRGVSLLAVLIAALPEVQVVLCVLRVMRGGLRDHPWQLGWLIAVGASAVAFTVGANLATIPARSWGDGIGEWAGWAAVVAVWPAWSTLSAAGLVDPSSLTRGHGAPQRAPARALKPAAPAGGAAQDPSARQGAASPVAARRAEGPHLPARATRQTAVLTALSEAGEPLSRAEVAARTGLERDAVKPVLRALVEAGHLTRVGEGPRTAYAQVGA